MKQFATEFPIKPLADRDAFVAQIRAWLDGTKYSTIFRSAHDLGGELVHLRASSNEALRIREIRGDNLVGIGMRHDYPDDDGRLWRTELVLRRDNAHRSDILRCLTQCIALEPNVRLETPRKPFLLKTLVRLWGGKDLCLPVADSPLWLTNDAVGLQIADSVTKGTAARYLPVVYISACGDREWLFTEDKIEKLAYDLGGVAHVVVEPSRAFSFRLRDATQGVNAYGGNVAISLPGEGLVRRFFLGWQIEDIEELFSAVRTAAIEIRSQMPTRGWDWTELQEEALRVRRERDRDQLTAQEIETLYQDEIKSLQERLRHLEQQLASRPHSVGLPDTDDLIPEVLVERIGPQIYPGEFSDRLRAAAREMLRTSQQTGLDSRSKAFFEQFSRKVVTSAGLKELREDLRRATKDPKRLPKELSALLARHGYQDKGDNRHVTLESRPNFAGLGNLTFPKTPSDHRSLENLRKQIERTLGITKLDI